MKKVQEFKLKLLKVFIPSLLNLKGVKDLLKINLPN
jgi:hypothetical protein